MKAPSAKKKTDHHLEAVLDGIEVDMAALVAGIAAEHQHKPARRSRQPRRERAKAA